MAASLAAARCRQTSLMKGPSNASTSKRGHERILSIAVTVDMHCWILCFHLERELVLAEGNK